MALTIHAIQSVLNEVLSLNAQELASYFFKSNARDVLNEVLSLNAQESGGSGDFGHALVSSMKS